LFDISTPTGETYGTFNEAFAALNAELFGGEPPDALITLQRCSRSRGYFAAQRFVHRRGSEIIDQIALKPPAMQNRTDREIASTLTHEMVRLLSYQFPIQFIVPIPDDQITAASRGVILAPVWLASRIVCINRYNHQLQTHFIPIDS
jgi:hypothetical protein